jgi:ankyrin repeat protein
MWAAGYADGAGVLDAENVVKLLLDRNADINAADDRGRTALMIAAELDHAAIVDTLVKHGADQSITDKQGKTALDLAVSDGVREALRTR